MTCNRYIEECMWVLNAVNRGDKLKVLKSIIQQISGEVFEDIKNENIST